MSYAIHPFAVSIASLEGAIGSTDKSLLRQIKRSHRGKFKEMDELDDEVTSTKECLIDLLKGRPLDEKAGFKYGYVLMMICESKGRMLPNDGWWGMRAAWIEEIDSILEEEGIEEDVLRIWNHLVGRGSPISLPAIDDFPLIGYLLNSEMDRVRESLITLSKEDDDEGTAIAQVLAWVDHCLASQEDLVCFYH